MAINPTNMANEIVAKLPSSWQPNWVGGQAPKEWIDKYVLDVQTMWTTSVMVSGTGPPPAGTYSHGHSMATVTPSSTNMGTLTYSALAATMFGVVAAELATHLLANAVVAQSDGAATHDHTISYPALLSQKPFAGLGATASTLKTNIITALNAATINGAPMPDQGDQNSLDIIFAAVAAGVLEHLENNGQLTALVGSGHVHGMS